jgi:hypothetical protein
VSRAKKQGASPFANEGNHIIEIAFPQSQFRAGRRADKFGFTILIAAMAENARNTVRC